MLINSVNIVNTEVYLLKISLRNEKFVWFGIKNKGLKK